MAAFCYCLYLLWSGKILYGTMTLFLSQGTKLTSAFNALVRTVPNFLNASVSAHRIRDLFALRPEPGQPVDDALECAAAQGVTVEVDGADFAYDPAPPQRRYRRLLCRRHQGQRNFGLARQAGHRRHVPQRLELAEPQPQRLRGLITA